MDTAKAVALRAKNEHFSWKDCFEKFANPFSDEIRAEALPVLAVTTTSGTGSHVTQASVISDSINKEKLTLFHSCLFPKESFVDPDFMRTVPQTTTAVTGFDAMCHAMESYFNPRANMLTETLSLQAISIIVETLPLVLEDPENIELREKLAYADTLAGICLSNAGAEAPHPIAETINGYFPKMAHGETLALVYPNYLSHASTAIPNKIETLIQILKNYRPSKDTGSLGELASETMKDFLRAIGLDKPFTFAGDKDALVQELKEKLFFNLPLTDSKQMQEILAKSL
ncbi:iron-containing alcohol dehydrogenase [Neobacillus notoginsengisoli]|uniref:Iron-containing alcohol dehydrogenase n=1 Tax=Neobacillus notoginsengisoli TaxID=1578198 RepID=A0A417YYN2_9BACI|nr:iron-containing alcohol dehydrogenase [Neobacillus notoginsengisoli]RHW42841.1 iron-containing alcohol dehydrogenase [Neobacillus notoginsengisoli]